MRSASKPNSRRCSPRCAANVVAVVARVLGLGHVGRKLLMTDMQAMLLMERVAADADVPHHVIMAAAERVANLHWRLVANQRLAARQYANRPW